MSQLKAARAIVTALAFIALFIAGCGDDIKFHASGEAALVSYSHSDSCLRGGKGIGGVHGVAGDDLEGVAGESPEGAGVDQAGNEADMGPHTEVPDAEVEVVVQGYQITVTHKNAMMNCCLDSIQVDFTQEEFVLKLVETEAVTIPCDCICPFKVIATIEVAMPGTYTIQIWTGPVLVWTGEAKVEGQG